MSLWLCKKSVNHITEVKKLFNRLSEMKPLSLVLSLQLDIRDINGFRF